MVLLRRKGNGPFMGLTHNDRMSMSSDTILEDHIRYVRYSQTVIITLAALTITLTFILPGHESLTNRGAFRQRFKLNNFCQGKQHYGNN